MILLLACTATPVDTADTADTGDSSLVETGDPVVVDGYGFDNASYSGQVFRNVLIGDTKGYLDELTARIDAGEYYPAEGDVEADLNFYFEFDSSVGGPLPHGVPTDPAASQSTYDDISSGKDIVGKLAGNDPTGQHKTWETEFVGWDHGGDPEDLVRAWFAEVDALAAARVTGDIPLSPDGGPLGRVYVSPEGQDYQQLIDKLLRCGVAWSQGADDYLDNDTADKGLLSDHTTQVEGKDYTDLEHAWDEGFGYFGAARTYGDWSDDEIRGVYMDVDGDGAIDLTSEYNFGFSVNAAKRDLGSVSGTDFTGQAFDNFVAGRQLLADTQGSELSAEQMDELVGYRDAALDAWERSISSTVVHYINDTIRDQSAMGTEDYDFAAHAKHWSEMKGFALGLQFSPHSPLGDEAFAAIHEAMGTGPELDPNELDAYKAGLLEARATLAAAYGFDAADLGDDDGENGW